MGKMSALQTWQPEFYSTDRETDGETDRQTDRREHLWRINRVMYALKPTYKTVNSLNGGSERLLIHHSSVPIIVQMRLKGATGTVEIQREQDLHNAQLEHKAILKPIFLPSYKAMDPKKEHGSMRSW